MSSSKSPPPSLASPSVSPSPMPVASTAASTNNSRPLAQANPRNSDRNKPPSSSNNNSTSTPTVVASAAVPSAATPNAHTNHNPAYKNRRNYDHMNNYNNNNNNNHSNSNNYSNRGGFQRRGGRGGFSNHFNNRQNQMGNSNNFHPENSFSNSHSANGSLVNGNSVQIQNSTKPGYSPVNPNVNLPTGSATNDTRHSYPNYSFNNNHNGSSPGPYYQQTQYMPMPGQFYNGYYPSMMVGNVGGPYNQLVNYNTYVPQNQNSDNEGFSTPVSEADRTDLAVSTSSPTVTTQDNSALLVSTTNFSASSASYPASSTPSTSFNSSTSTAFSPAAFSTARPFTHKPKPAVVISLRDPNSGQALDLNQYVTKGGVFSSTTPSSTPATVASSSSLPSLASTAEPPATVAPLTEINSISTAPVTVPATKPSPPVVKKSDVAEAFRKQVQAKLALERKEKERLEQERLEKERLEKEKLEKERLEKEQLEKERLEKERLEKERLEKEQLEKEQLEKEQLEKERLEKERLEKERLAKERLEKEQFEKERFEKERFEKELLQKEKLESDIVEKTLIQKTLIIEGHIMEKIKEESKEGESSTVSRESTPVAMSDFISTIESTSNLSALFVKSLMNAAPAINVNIVYPTPAFAPQTHKPGHYDVGFLMQFRGRVLYPPKPDWSLVRNKIQIGGGSSGGYSVSGNANGGGFRDGSRYKNVSRGGHSGGHTNMGHTNLGHGHGFGHGGMGNFGSDFNGPNSGINSLNGPLGMNSNNSRSNSRRGRDNDLGMFNKTPMGDRRQNSSRRGGREANMSNRTGSNRGGGSGMGGTHRSHFGSSRADDGNMNRSGSNYNNNNNLPLEPVEPLVRSENAWTPRLKKEKEVNPSEITSETRMAPEIVQRKVNSLLNKMTLEKFDKISGQILDIAAQSKYEDDGRTLRQVIELTFAKATDEAHWSSMYARFCQKMQEEIDPQIQDRSILDKEGLPVRSNMLFRKYLLSRCQAEFEKGWVDKIPTHDETTPTDAQSMSEDYYKAAAAKRRGLGLIKFIGELYMLDMITERIMHGCIQRLLMTETGPGEDPSEDLIESLSKLLTTIGEKLDASCRMTDWLEGYYAKMDKLTKSPTLPPRLRFMLMDVIDLRKHHWQSKNKEKGPKTIAEVHEDAAKAEQQKETARQQMQKNTSGRNNSRYNSNNNNHNNSNNVSPHEIANFGRFQGSGSNNFGPSTGLLSRNSPGSRSNSSNTNSYGSPPHHNVSHNKSHSNLTSSSSMGNSSAKNILKRVTHDD